MFDDLMESTTCILHLEIWLYFYSRSMGLTALQNHFTCVFNRVNYILTDVFEIRDGFITEFSTHCPKYSPNGYVWFYFTRGWSEHMFCQSYWQEGFIRRVTERKFAEMLKNYGVNYGNSLGWKLPSEKLYLKYFQMDSFVHWLWFCGL